MAKQQFPYDYLWLCKLKTPSFYFQVLSSQFSAYLDNTPFHRINNLPASLLIFIEMAELELLNGEATSSLGPQWNADKAFVDTSYWHSGNTSRSVKLSEK